MSSGAGEDDAQPVSPEIAALRARLYAPGSTAADRAAYDAAVAEQTLGPEAPPEPTPDEQDSGTAPAAAAAAPPPPARPSRPVLLGALAVALLVLGAGIGAGLGTATSGIAAPATPSASARPSVARSAPPLPTPVGARSLPIGDGDRKAAVAALDRVLASGPDDTALNRALQTIGPELSDPRVDGAWMSRYGCSTSTGIDRTSTRGRPVVLTTADQALTLPAQSHFRITIYLTRPAGWSWVLSAGRGSGESAPIAVGAGSPEAGQVQYADFDATAPGDLTRVEVSSTGSTPFLFQLESCVSSS